MTPTDSQVRAQLGDAVVAQGLVRRYYAELVNGHRFEVADELFAPAFPGFAGASPGPAGVRAYLTKLVADFPDLHATVHQVVAAQDLQVVAHVTLAGTYRGLAPAVDSEGPLAETTHIAIFRIVDGRIASVVTAGWAPVPPICLVRLPLWTGVYVGGALIADGHRLEPEAWLTILHGIGVSYATSWLDTVPARPGGYLPDGSDGPDGYLPAHLDDLRDWLTRRRAELEEMRTAEARIRSLEQELERVRRQWAEAQARAKGRGDEL